MQQFSSVLGIFYFGWSIFFLLTRAFILTKKGQNDILIIKILTQY